MPGAPPVRLVSVPEIRTTPLSQNEIVRLADVARIEQRDLAFERPRHVIYADPGHVDVEKHEVRLDATQHAPELLGFAERLDLIIAAVETARAMPLPPLLPHPK